MATPIERVEISPGRNVFHTFLRNVQRSLVPSPEGAVYADVGSARPQRRAAGAFGGACAGLLALDLGESAPTVAVTVQISPQAVRNIARRYRAHGLDAALGERPLPETAEILAAYEMQWIIAMMCSDPPPRPGAARWTVRVITGQTV